LRAIGHARRGAFYAGFSTALSADNGDAAVQHAPA